MYDLSEWKNNGCTYFRGEKPSRDFWSWAQRFWKWAKRTNQKFVNVIFILAALGATKFIGLW